MFGGDLTQKQMIGMMALGDAFSSLGSIGSGRPSRSRALPLAFQMKAQEEQDAKKAAANAQFMTALGLGPIPDLQPETSANRIPPSATPPIVPWDFDTSGVSPEAIKALSGTFDAFGKRLPVNSAHRTPEHNAKVGGASGSQHLHGNAFDIDVSGMSPEDSNRLIKTARENGFGGVGVYENSLHFDVGDQRHWGPSHGRDSIPDWAMGAVTTPAGQLAPQQAPQAPPQARKGYPQEIVQLARAYASAGDMEGAKKVLTDYTLRASTQQASGPNIEQAADGFKYYADGPNRGQRVFPNVQKAPQESPIASLEARAAAAGLSPGTDEYKQFMLDRAGQTINVDTRGENKWEETVAKSQATMFSEIATNGINAQGEIAQINEMESLLSEGLGGTVDVWQQWAQDTLGVNIGAGGASEAFSSLVSRLVPQQRPPGSGQMSDRDVQLFKESLPQLVNSPQGNALILETMRGMAEFKRAQGEIANSALVGRISRQEAMEQLYKLPDPLAKFRAARTANPDRRDRLKQLRGGE